MGRVNRVPRGFLDLLGTQAQGQTPPEFSEILAPTVDLQDFYVSDALAGVRKDVSFGAEGVTQFIVPTDEIWLLRGGSVTTVLDSSTRYEQWALQVSSLPRSSELNAVTGDQSSYLWVSPLLQVQANNERVIAACTLPAPFVMLPGTAVNWRLTQRDAAAARTSEFSVLASILKAQ